MLVLNEFDVIAAFVALALLLRWLVSGDGTTLVPSKQDVGWWHSPLATAEEAEVVAQAVRLVREKLREGVAIDPHVELLALRRLRAVRFGRRAGELITAAADAQGVAQTCVWAIEWRADNCPKIEPRGPTKGTWYAAIELPQGEWADQFMAVGMRTGRARGGHPVKVERCGRHDTAGLGRDPDGEARLREYYYGMLDDMQHTLDVESLACGALLRTYEVWDMEGITIGQMLSPTVLRVSIDVLKIFSKAFTGITARVCIINMPSWAMRLLDPLLAAVPAHVRSRVVVLGADWEPTVAQDVDAEALSLIKADARTLARHRGTRL